MAANTPYAPNNLTERPKAYDMELFAAADPAEIAERTGCGLEGDTLIFTVLGRQMRMTWPDFGDEGWTDKDRILMLHYALEGKAAAPSFEFASYAELPWGEVYDRNFRGRCIMRMLGMFGRNIDGFCRVCEALGGRRVAGSGVIYELDFMKDLCLRFIIWEGDEEFAPSGQILFSKNFPDAFAAEDRVVVCEHTLGRMKAELAKQ